MFPARSVRSAWLFSWRVLAVLFLAGLIGWGGSWLYIQRRDRMLYAAASSAIDSGDFASSWFWLQRLYRAQPGNIEANRLIARFEAAQRSPEELAWRVRVIQIGPATLDDYLGWASAALRLNQTSIALEALGRVPAQWKNSAPYHELLASASLAAGQLQAADDNFAAAARIEPSNPLHAVNLASLRLAAAGNDTRQAARATLEHLASTSDPRPATRALLDDAVRQRDPARIARFRDALRAIQGHTIDDELACIAADPTPHAAHANLVTLWDSIKADPGSALLVAEWMMRRGDSFEALAWLRNLPASAQSLIPIQMGEADGLTAARDWPALRAFLSGKNWQNSGFLRIALLVRCARETGAATPAWPDAIAACKGDGSSLLLLAQTAAGWNWQTETEAVYWHISGLGFPSRGPALQALWDFYTLNGNTAGLLRVAREQHSDSPSDPAIRNNLAFLSLLTGIGDAEARRIAEEDSRDQPENPNFAATYAYALYLDGRYQEGLRVLSRFGVQRMKAAGAALYLALLEQAAGDGQAAVQSAAAVDSAKLLPEERLLLQKIEPKTSGAAVDIRPRKLAA